MSATNRGSVRKESDFYPTPPEAFRPLLPFIVKLNLPVWEPACGDGRLISMMRHAGIKVGGDDLIKGYDFLEDATPRHCIVTNPPFSLALEFCDHALPVSSHTFLLLRLNFLGAVSRRAWWQDHEPDAIFVLSNRPRFINNKSDACEYGWFYWGSTWRGIRHL